MRTDTRRTRAAAARRAFLPCTRALVCVAAFTLVAGSAVTTDAESSSRGTASFARPDEPLREYKAYRRMHAWTERFNQEAWLEAWTELKNGQFQYQIVSERGSDTKR